MSVSAETVANSFLALAEREGKSLTNMQVQKLVYIAHGYCLALLDRPLISTDVKAWQFGPVYPKLYKKLSKFGAGEVTEKIENGDPLPSESEEFAVIDAVWRAYGSMSGGKLSALTHRQGSPWSQVWDVNQYGSIGDELISNHYKQILATNNESAAH